MKELRRLVSSFGGPCGAGRGAAAGFALRSAPRNKGSPQLPGPDSFRVSAQFVAALETWRMNIAVRNSIAVAASFLVAAAAHAETFEIGRASCRERV